MEYIAFAPYHGSVAPQETYIRAIHQYLKKKLLESVRDTLGIFVAHMEKIRGIYLIDRGSLSVIPSWLAVGKTQSFMCWENHKTAESQYIQGPQTEIAPQ